MSSAGLSRRQAMTAAAALGVGVPVLAACGGSSGGGSTSGTSAQPSPTTGSSSGGGGGGAAAALATTGDLEVGGAVFVDDPSVVVTEPEDGVYRAFSRTCTHQGCPVADLVDGNIHCPCHGSMFSIADGSPVSGPAQTPLAEVAITVKGDQILPA